MTADPLEMELVALNLMKNALEASDAAGGAGEVVVTLSEEDDRAILAVADDGGTRETVERLNRGLGSTKAEGLGFGLSIVRGILEAYGGRLAFSARRQGGLVARATVPVRGASSPVKSSGGRSHDVKAHEGGAGDAGDGVDEAQQNMPS